MIGSKKEFAGYQIENNDAVRRLSEQEEKLSEYTKSLIDKVEKEHEAESVAKKHEVRKYQY